VFPPNNKYNVEQSSFNSSMLKNVFIKEFNLSKKPRRIPQRLWQADKNTVSSFLRGLYAADGHVETQKTAVSIVLAQNDKVFLQEIQVLLSNFGLVSYIFDHGKSVVKKIKYADGREFYTNRKPCYRLVLSGFEQCEVFYKEISLGVPIKNKRLEIGLNKIKNCKKLTGSYRTSRVEKIENIGLQQTFCLTEPFTNTVTVNGIVTGNCRCELTTLLPGFGFENGNLIYKQESWDEYEHQRNL
jgi:intein/homing endonuclease